MGSSLLSLDAPIEEKREKKDTKKQPTRSKALQGKKGGIRKEHNRARLHLGQIGQRRLIASTRIHS